MNFTPDKAIYLQIADRICDQILAGEYAEEARIPSVREYAVLLEVNVNTAVKAFDQLARDEIIYIKRGLGYFVSPGAARRIKQQRRTQFIDEQLPALFRNMQLLGISIEEVTDAWQKKMNGD